MKLVEHYEKSKNILLYNFICYCFTAVLAHFFALNAHAYALSDSFSLIYGTISPTHSHSHTHTHTHTHIHIQTHIHLSLSHRYINAQRHPSSIPKRKPRQTKTLSVTVSVLGNAFAVGPEVYRYEQYVPYVQYVLCVQSHTCFACRIFHLPFLF